jgi:farnesyl diphosphate synthase
MFNTIIKPYIEDGISILTNYQIKEILEYNIYSGKCIRGFITKYIMNKLSDNKIDDSFPIFLIEALQSLSLILDDLPCMDNSILRRNKPSTHIKFTESETLLTSIYVAMKLQAKLIEKIYDFDIKTAFYYKDEKLDRVSIVKLLNESLDENIILGQLLDLGHKYDYMLEKHPLSRIYNKDTMIIILKTSSLFSLAFLLGVFFSNKPELDLYDFYDMGIHYGILYQIVDDLIDYNEDSKKNYNYVHSVGIDKVAIIYTEHKTKLLYLLKKYDLFNDEFCKIINILDKKFYNTINT